MTTLATILLISHIIFDSFLFLFFVVGFGLTMWEIRVNNRNGITCSIRAVTLASAIFAISLIVTSVTMLDHELTMTLTVVHAFSALARLGLTITLIGLVKRLADEAAQAQK